MRLNKYITEEKKLSVGLILTDGEVFLAVRPTNGFLYDMPKGMGNPGENPVETIVREFKEETNIDISRYKSQLTPMGKHYYTNYKDVDVFVLKLENLPSISSMKCTSMFHIRPDELAPEVDQFHYINWNNLKMFNSGMKNILEKVREKIKNP
jgi:8-oxo-dGTP pyrophosphatase MutT (NUDIX family)